MPPAPPPLPLPGNTSAPGNTRRWFTGHAAHLGTAFVFELQDGPILSQGRRLGHDGLCSVLGPLGFRMAHHVLPHVPCTV